MLVEHGEAHRVVPLDRVVATDHILQKVVSSRLALPGEPAAVRDLSILMERLVEPESDGTQERGQVGNALPLHTGEGRIRCVGPGPAHYRNHSRLRKIASLLR